MSHENIHKCLDFYEDDQILVLVTEPLICDVADLISEVGRPLNEDATRSIFKNVLLAVSHLHE